MTQATPELPLSEERRGAPRFALLFRTAKVVIDQKEYLCVLRDASATGCKIRLFHALPTGAEFALELGNGGRYPADFMWHSDDHAGLRFKSEIDVGRLLSDNYGQYPKRQIRMKFDRPALVTAQGRSFEVLLRNISQQGTCIECSHVLRVLEPVSIEIEGFPLIYGKVCWRRSCRHGVVFERGFGLTELAGLLGHLH